MLKEGAAKIESSMGLSEAKRRDRDTRPKPDRGLEVARSGRSGSGRGSSTPKPVSGFAMGMLPESSCTGCRQRLPPESRGHPLPLLLHPGATCPLKLSPSKPRTSSAGATEPYDYLGGRAIKHSKRSRLVTTAFKEYSLQSVPTNQYAKKAAIRSSPSVPENHKA